MTINTNHIKPREGSVLLKPFDRPLESASGLVMPEKSYDDTPVIGEVIAVAEHSTLAVGSVVLFRRYSVDELRFNTDGNQQVAYLVDEKDIVAEVQSPHE